MESKEMENWSDGVMRKRHEVMEHWNNGLKKRFFQHPHNPITQYSNTPVLHHSNTPVLADSYGTLTISLKNNLVIYRPEKV
jgi:hypothetical protein